jgi:hypothetical protein
MVPVRNMRAGTERAILHHGCTKTGITGYWGALDWWACQAPDRPLDEYTRFDQYCIECGSRWLEFEQGPLSLRGPVTAEEMGGVWVERLLSDDADVCPACGTPLTTSEGSRLISRTDSNGLDRWECPDCGTAWQKDLT